MDKIPFAPLTEFQRRQRETVETLIATVQMPEFRLLSHERQIDLVRAALALAFCNGGCAALEIKAPLPKTAVPMPTAGHA
jgi:hypothetical protein